ncbi:MAG: hypothetical protein WBV45_09175 [Lutimonas sp.]
MMRINIPIDRYHSFREDHVLILFKTKVIDMKWYTFLITLALLFIQCGGDGDTPPWDDPDRDSPTPWRGNFGTVTMKIDGGEIVMRAYDQANFTSDQEGQYVKIEAVNCEDFIRVGMLLVPQIGSHDIVRGKFTTDKIGHECFEPGSGPGYTFGKDHSISGTATITELGVRIKGTFEFTASHINDGTTYVITNGSFDIEVDIDSDG